MPTTLEIFAGQRPRNYCKMPQRDVEILPKDPVCSDCRRAVVKVEVSFDNGHGVTQTQSVWVHADTPDAFEVRPSGAVPRVRSTGGHYISPAVTCTYCGTNDPADLTWVSAPWSEECHCARCGGVHGFGIGD